MFKEGKDYSKLNITGRAQVSVVIPYFNRSHCLFSLIDCLNKQVFKSFEVIFIDDCSDVSLTSALSSFSSGPKFDYRIFRNNENRGVSYSRNIGIDNAKYEYIAFLDSDDYWYPTKLLECVNAVSESVNGDLFLMSKTLVETSNGDVVLPNISRFNELRGEDYLFTKGYFAQVSSFFISASLARKVRFNERLAQFEDYLFFIESFNSASKTVFVNKCLGIWKDGDDSSRLSLNKEYQQALDFIREGNRLSEVSISEFYCRFVTPYFFYTNVSSSLKACYLCLSRSRMSVITVLWMLSKGILGVRIINRLRSVVLR